MSTKEKKHSKSRSGTKQRLTKHAAEHSDMMAQQQVHPATIVQRARSALSSLTASSVLQLQRTVGNQAVRRLLARMTQDHSIQNDVVQRQGATPVNWHTISITADAGFIKHAVGWGSSTGKLDDLKDVQTREEVTWNQACPWADAKNDKTYTSAGQHHGMGTTRGHLGQNTDTHQASQPYFDDKNPPLIPGQTMTFVMTQVYQYSTDGGATWLDIPNSKYTLTRTLRRIKRLFGDEYEYTLTKEGDPDKAVNLTTKVKVSL